MIFPINGETQQGLKIFNLNLSPTLQLATSAVSVDPGGECDRAICQGRG